MKNFNSKSVLAKCVIFISLCFPIVLNAQISGIKTIGSSGDYTTIAAAIDSLNLNGVGAGGVTFNVAAGHTETAANLVLTTTTSSLLDPIVFQKSGTGLNPKITAGIGISTSVDGFVLFQGTDYVTFDAIDLEESSSNTTTTMQMEFGYGILTASPTNASQYISIKNCNITLNRTNIATNGIRIYNHKAFTNAPIIPTSLDGVNSYCKINGNTISNSYRGIFISGYNSPTYYGQGNEIGTTAGNTILDFGGTNSIAHGIFSRYQNDLKIANSTINGGNGQTQSLYGIYCWDGINSNLDIYNNTITLTAPIIANTIYGISFGMGGAGTSNTVNIYGNIIQNCAFTSVTTATFYGFSMDISSSPAFLNFHDNQFINNTYGDSSVAGTGAIYAMNLNGSPNSTLGSTWNTYNNTVSGNTRIQPTPGSGAFYAINQLGYGLTTNVYDNNIFNNTSLTKGTYSIQYLLYVGGDSSTTKNIYGNNIYNHLAAGGPIYGIYNSNGLLTNIYKNNIYNININSAAGYIYGIYQALGATTNIYNNNISQFYSTGSVYNPSLYGAYLASGTNVNMYYNTIYLDASSIKNGFGSAGIYATPTSIVDLRNNIVVNNSTPGPVNGRTVALYYSAPIDVNYSALSNNNCFYAGTPGLYNLIYYVNPSNSDQTLAAFQTRVAPSDTASISEIPPFVNVTSLPYDLHLSTGTPSQCAGGGQVISWITDDYDGYLRDTISPTIGANEGSSAGLDLIGPTITHARLDNLSTPASQTLKAIIVDGTGVPIAGVGLPVLYWRINAGSWSNVQGLYLSADTFLFTFGSGTVPGDTIHYYIAAQDTALTHNVSIFPSNGASGFTSNPPAASTPPANPDYYVVSLPISGIYTINKTMPNSATNFHSFKDAVWSLNNHGISGPLTLNVASGTYNESFVINNVQGSSSINTITFQSSSGDSSTVILTYSPLGPNDNWTIRLNGTNHIRFKKMSIVSTGATFGRVVEVLNGASYNSFENNVMISGGSSTTCSVVYDYTTLNHYNTYKNNYMYGGYYSVYINGTDTVTWEKGTVIEGNEIVGFYYYSIYLHHTDSSQVIGNYIHDAEGPNSHGIYCYNINNAYKITGNKVVITGTTATANYGIYDYYGNYVSYNPSPSGYGLVANNFVVINGGIGANCGIYSYYGNGTKYYYNSINLTSGSTGSYALYQKNTASNTLGQSYLNNAFVNTGGGYAAYYAAPTNVAVNNNNNYFTSSTSFVYWLGAQTSLAALQAINGKDLSSISADPMFISATDLHSISTLMNAHATPVVEVSTDIDGQLRDIVTPDIGADEYTPVSTDIALVAILQPLAAHAAVGVSTQVEVLIRNLGTDTITSFTVSYKYANNNPVSYNWTGELLAGGTVNHLFATSFSTLVGQNTIKTYVGAIGTNLSNDSISKLFVGVPLISVPWSDNFDQLPYYWVSEGSNKLWQQGVPAASKINSAKSTPNVWATNLTGQYPTNVSAAFLYSPFFDFSNMTDAVMKFWHWREAQANDGCNLQVSTNGGQSWVVVGSMNDPLGTNWYTNNFGGTNAWSGSSAGWVQSTYDLSIYNNYATPVQFRFKFFSDTLTNDNGFAIDNFEIVFAPVINDVGVVEIVNPRDTTYLNFPAMDVVVKIVNFGTSSISNFPVIYSTDGVNLITEVYTDTILPSDTLVFRFAVKLSSLVGAYQLCSRTLLVGDADTLNDKICESLFGTVNSIGEIAWSGLILGQNVPNPAIDVTVIKYSVPKAGSIVFELTDFIGQTLIKNEDKILSGSNQIELDIQSLAAGIYYYSITFEGERFTKKMVIRK